MKNTFLEEYKRRTLRQCQLKQLGILEEIDRICRKHDISYWLDGGSLLVPCATEGSFRGTTTSTSP